MAHDLVQIGTRRDDAERMVRWAHMRPRAAMLYLENRCHLRCEHCYESEESHPKTHSLSLEEYERIFRELADLGVLSLTFSGGEIFLRRDLLDIVAAARRHRFAVTLYTSGTLIDEKKADRIAELKVSDVHVSVYSHDAAVHDRFTGIPGSHARSVRALELLRERKVATVLKSNLTTFNIDHIDELIALARSLGADWQFDPTVKPRMDGDRAPLEYALTPDVLRRRVLSRPDLTQVFRNFEPEQLCSGEVSILRADSVVCSAARSILSIGADGGVYACSFFPVPGGSLRSTSLKDIWFGSSQFDQIRQTRFGKLTACQSCSVSSTCAPCMAYSHVENGHLHGCNTASRQAAEALHLLAEHKAKANAKLKRGRALPLVGDASYSRLPLKDGRAPLGADH